MKSGSGKDLSNLSINRTDACHGLRARIKSLENDPPYRKAVDDEENMLQTIQQLTAARVKGEPVNGFGVEELGGQIHSLSTKRKSLIGKEIAPRQQEINRLQGMLRRVEGPNQKKRDRATVLDVQGASLKQVMQQCPLIVAKGPVVKYINPATDWKSKPRLYFGMGGGSQNLTEGLPLDVVGMVLVGEVLRRTLKLERCSILCADVITRTNPFPLPDIQRVMEGERDIVRYLLKRLGFREGWDVVLHSDLHAMKDGGEVVKETIQKVRSDDCRHQEYIKILQVMCQYIDEGIARSPYAELGKDARGHEDNWHFALETALTEYLVGNGIHLGWYIPGPEVTSAHQVSRLISQFGRAGLKRMDEEPFDSYHEHTLAVAIEKGAYKGPNRVSAVYCPAGVRIPTADKRELVERVPPYIDYRPEQRLFLGDTPDEIRRKLGMWWEYPGGGALTRFWGDFLKLADMFGMPVSGGDIVDDICVVAGWLQEDGELQKIYARTFPPA